MNAQQIFLFLFAGNATFTLQSVESGTHFTYRVRARNGRGGGREPFFASLLVAPDTYAYLGVLEPRGLRITANSRISAGAPGFKALDWFMRELARTKLDAVPAKVLFRHEGACGRCGRALTTPASIDTGFGPDCAEMLGVAHECRGVEGDMSAPGAVWREGEDLRGWNPHLT